MGGLLHFRGFTPIPASDLVLVVLFRGDSGSAGEGGPIGRKLTVGGAGAPPAANRHAMAELLFLMVGPRREERREEQQEWRQPLGSRPLQQEQQPLAPRASQR